MKMRALACLFGMVLVMTACAAPAAAGPKIHVENAWARPAMVSGSMGAPGGTPDAQMTTDMSATQTSAMPGMLDGTNSAVYFVIVNDGGEADTLTGVSTPVASQAGLHETQISGNIAQMVPIASLTIPAHGKVAFQPGGYHVMLEGLKQSLKEGDTLQVTLQFQKSGPMTIDVPVRQQQ